MRYLLAFVAVLTFSSSLFAEPLWVDVRSEREHAKDHIQEHLRIDHANISHYFAENIDDKDTEILLYCRSGRRANIAMNALKMAGYTNVVNVGSIADARNMLANTAPVAPQASSLQPK